MIIIGIVGGVAAGKSSVAAKLKELGAAVIDADKIASKVIDWPEVRDQLRINWGDQNWGNDISLRELKRLVGAIVFDNPKELEKLEAIVMPLIVSEIKKSFSRYNKKYTPVMVLDAPLLFESGLDSLCNEIWFVEAPEEQRRKAYVARECFYGDVSGTVDYLEKSFAAREARQITTDKKKFYSKLIIKNIFESDNPVVTSRCPLSKETVNCIVENWNRIKDYAEKSLNQKPICDSSYH